MDKAILSFLEPLPEHNLEETLPDGVVALEPSVLEKSESVLSTSGAAFIKVKHSGIYAAVGRTA